MRILEDGSVEIRSSKGNTKIVQPKDLPSYGISYSDYETQKGAYQTAIKGETEDKTDPLAPQKQVASEALNLLESRYGRGDPSAVGTGRDISFSGGGNILERIIGSTGKLFRGKETREDVNAYKNVLETFLPVFTQAFGSGAPQEGEAKRLKNAAPGPKSSDKEAKRWFADVRSLLSGKVETSGGLSPEDEELIKKYAR